MEFLVEEKKKERKKIKERGVLEFVRREERKK